MEVSCSKCGKSYTGPMAGISCSIHEHMAHRNDVNYCRLTLKFKSNRWQFFLSSPVGICKKGTVPDAIYSVSQMGGGYTYWCYVEDDSSLVNIARQRLAATAHGASKDVEHRLELLRKRIRRQIKKGAIA